MPITTLRRMMLGNIHPDTIKSGSIGWLGYCLTPYQRLKLYYGAQFSRLLRHAGDTEDVFSN